MILRQRRSTRPYTLFPYTPLFRATGFSEIDIVLRIFSVRGGAGREWPLPGSPHRARSARISFNRRNRWKGSVGLGSKSKRSYQARASSSLARSEEHTSELQSLMRISYAVFCLKKKTKRQHET